MAAQDIFLERPFMHVMCGVQPTAWRTPLVACLQSFGSPNLPRSASKCCAGRDHGDTPEPVPETGSSAPGYARPRFGSATGARGTPFAPRSAAALAALYGANNTDAAARSCPGSSDQQSGCRHRLCPS